MLMSNPICSFCCKVMCHVGRLDSTGDQIYFFCCKACMCQVGRPDSTGKVPVYRKLVVMNQN